MNVGEQICGDWLQHVKGCEFIQFNLPYPDEQGELDVLALNMTERTVFACEVAVHLTTGLQYVSRGKADNVARLVGKFRKSVAYVQKTFEGYDHVFMLWSPVVRDQKLGSKHNQLRDVKEIIAEMEKSCQVAIQPVINADFQRALDELRAYARHETKALESPVLRYLQIEEALSAHLVRLAKQAGRA